ncbi:MAG: hypothetical protein IPK02_04215 [Candidatus Accumulibacter sp.]|uniref:Uncharacterized protein n=1 Tax=Candidatus Accumulibacter affinis TaxID=2954384 RepID=A0A935T7T6_9PROT|nr:hypothetical protein [Candidatus Accumulibacter affinis]
MRSRRLIYFGAQQVRTFHWRAGVLTEEAVFDAGEAGKQRFASYLAANPKSIFTILANVSDEGFHSETIPFLRGADRQAIITRKLGQQFFNATLTTSISLGHEKSRRKDERILLAALTSNEFFAPWLLALATAGAPLAGIYSLPLLGPLLARKLGIPDERCLLLTIQDQSIRQSYLEKGELHFSRLTPLQNSSIESMAQTFASESRKLQQYLVSQRLLGRQQRITAYLLVHAAARKVVESHCTESVNLSFAILDMDDCAHWCKLKTVPTDTHCEPLFLHLLATSPPRTQFASDAQRHDYQLWRLRSALRRTGAVVLLGSLLWAGKQTYDAHHLNQEIHIIQAEAALSRQRYDQILKTFPPIPTSNENLRRVINRYLDLEKGSGSPTYLWREISRALQGAAAVELDGIEWKVAAAQAPRVAARSDAQRYEPPPANSEVAVVRGTLRLGPDSHPRQVLAVFNHLLDTLKRNPQLQVEVLQQPFDVESGKALKSGEAAVEDRQPRSFKLQIRRTIGT